MRCIESLKALRRLQLKCSNPMNPIHGFHEHLEPEQLLWLARVAQVIEDSFRKKLIGKYKNHFNNKVLYQAAILMEGKEIQLKCGSVKSLELDCFNAGLNYDPLVELYAKSRGFTYEEFKKCYSFTDATDNMRKAWTAKEVTFLKKWYGRKKLADIAKELSRTVSSISAKASLMRLPNENKKRRRS